MTMTTAVAKSRITREIAEAEASLNDALIRQSQLFATMLIARRDAGETAFTGQDALLRLAKSQQSLLAASGDLARVHGRLVDINREMGGLADDCPDDWRKLSFDDSAVAA